MSRSNLPSRRTFLQATGLTLAAATASVTLPGLARAAAGTPPVLLTDQIRSALPGEGNRYRRVRIHLRRERFVLAGPQYRRRQQCRPDGAAASPPAGSVAGSIASATNWHIATKIPAGLGAGPIAVYVSSPDHSTWAKPLLLNGPRGWYVDHPQAKGNQSVTLYGRDLKIGTTSPTISIGNSSTLHACTVTASTPYAVTFTVPTGLAVGTYTIYAANGLGGQYAFDNSVQLAIVAAPTGIPMSLNVVSGFGADPSGATDSTTSLQNALNAASASGTGAVVTFPPGTYVTSSKLMLPASTHPVTLQGSTAGTSLIRFNPSAAYPASIPAMTTYDCYGVSASDDIGMLYLAPAAGPVTLSYLDFDANDKTVICVEVDARNDVTVEHCLLTNDNWPSNIYLYSGAYAVVAQNCQRLNVSGCTITANAAIFLLATLDSIVETTSFALTYPRSKTDPANPPHQADQDGIRVWGGRRLTLRGNTFDRGSSTYYYARAVQLGALKVPSSVFGAAQACGVELAYIGDNQIKNAGEPGSNCGETIVGDQFNTVTGGRIALSTSAATATTISTGATSFGAASDPSLDAVGTDIMILSGTGTGQIRRVVSNTASQLTVGAPWDVIPATDSVFTVVVLHKRQIHYNNTMTACPKYLGNYGPGAFCVFAGNAFDSTGAVTPDPPSAEGSGISIFGLITGNSPALLDPNWYDEILDNTINHGHVTMAYVDYGTASSTIPAGAVVRSNRAARNQASNANSTVTFEPTSLTGTTAVMGKHNLSVLNVRGTATTENTVIGDSRWDHSAYQGAAADLMDSGTSTASL